MGYMQIIFSTSSLGDTNIYIYVFLLDRKSPELFAPHHSSLAMSDITINVPTINEAKNLRQSIPLAAKLGPVILIDSRLTDVTAHLARGLGSEVLNFEWNGKFPEKRNWTLRKYDFKTKWGYDQEV